MVRKMALLAAAKTQIEEVKRVAQEQLTAAVAEFIGKKLVEPIAKQLPK